MKDIPLQEALTLLDLCPQPMVLLENTGRVRGFNQAFRELVGESAGDAADLALDPGLLHPLLGTSTVINWIMPDGNERWLVIEVFDVADTPGTQVRFFRDITETLRLRHERDVLRGELDKQSLHHGQLTSLLSRVGILVLLEPLVARSRRYHSPLSLITLSINSGQDAMRTAALDLTAALLRDQTRWADLIGCNDNQDFILVLQETTRDAALLLVEKLAQHIEHIDAADAGPLTAWYGITECRKGDNAGSFLERAETALAEAGQNDSGRAIAL